MSRMIYLATLSEFRPNGFGFAQCKAITSKSSGSYFNPTGSNVFVHIKAFTNPVLKEKVKQLTNGGGSVRFWCDTEVTPKGVAVKNIWVTQASIPDEALQPLLGDFIFESAIHEPINGLSLYAARQMLAYVELFKRYNCCDQSQANAIITRENRWDRFPDMAALNNHGGYKDVPGITPGFFALTGQLIGLNGGGAKLESSKRRYQ